MIMLMELCLSPPIFTVPQVYLVILAKIFDRGVGGEGWGRGQGIDSGRLFCSLLFLSFFFEGRGYGVLLVPIV